MNTDNFTCPKDFVPDELMNNESYRDALNDLSMKLGLAIADDEDEISTDSADYDIYLVKVPVGVDVDRLNKKHISLDGITDLGKFDETDPFSYESHCTTDENQVENLSILVPGVDDRHTMRVTEKKFKGQINILKTLPLPSDAVPDTDVTMATRSPDPETHPIKTEITEQKSKKNKKKSKQRD